MTGKAASAEQLSPQPDFTVAYYPFIEFWGRGPPEGDEGESVIMTAGHGRPPPFTISLSGPGANRAEIRTPGDLDGHDLQAREAVSPRQDGRSQYWEATYDYEQLEPALVHHRPPFTITFDRGRIRRQSNRQSDRYASCARHQFEMGVRRIEAAAIDEQDRRDARIYRGYLPRDIPSPLPHAELLLYLMSLEWQPVENGRLLQRARQRLAERSPVEPPDQGHRRNERMLAHGREFQAEVDLLTDRHSPYARVCRMASLRGLRQVRRDTCRFSAMVDQRDGWPIFISIRREQEAQNGARTGRADFFSRIVPLEGFVPPPRFCPAT